MKKIIIAVIVLMLVGAGYWYASSTDWFTNTGPDNLPTKDELKRMEEITESSSTIAPNAVPGAGVRPRGSLPPQEQAPADTSTSTTETEL